MNYQIIRTDGEIDDITTQSFQTYDEAYDLLANIYEDICCSDADYDDRPYYEIMEIKNVSNYSIQTVKITINQASLKVITKHTLAAFASKNRQ